ncbi:MAG: ABC transporter permease [Acidimicrobiales bacterium]
MRKSFMAEMAKLVRRPALWVLLALWFALALAFGYLIPYAVYSNPPTGISDVQQAQLLASLVPSGWLGNVVGGFPLFGAAMMVVATAMVVGSEYGWSTMATVMTQRPGRLQVLGGKLAALVVVAVAFEAVVFAPGALASSIITRAVGGPVDWPQAAEVLKVLGAGFLIFAVWAAIGSLLAVGLRSTSLPIGLGLVWLLVVEGLIAGFAGSLDLLATVRGGLPGANGGALAASFLPADFPDTPGVSSFTGPGHAVVVLAVWGVGAVLVTAWLLRRRDVA